MNIIIITCPNLALDRLSTQIAQMSPAVAAGLISKLHIICMDDSEARRRVNTPYMPEKWSIDIAIGWENFRGNIIAQFEPNDTSRVNYLQTLTSGACFPSRTLTSSEHSVALRHILAIETIARANSPCIVIEDDALVRDESLFHELLQGFRTFCKNRIFYDLTDGYIPTAKSTFKALQIGRLRYCPRPVAATRTLMAYAMSPYTAKILFNSLTHYSLPIDMQIQVLLSRLYLPGLLLANSPFVHGSKTDAMSSSVRQF
jgi:hypothetical protein